MDWIFQYFLTAYYALQQHPVKVFFKLKVLLCDMAIQSSLSDFDMLTIWCKCLLSALRMPLSSRLVFLLSLYVTYRFLWLCMALLLFDNYLLLLCIPNISLQSGMELVSESAWSHIPIDITLCIAYLYLSDRDVYHSCAVYTWQNQARDSF